MKKHILNIIGIISIILTSLLIVFFITNIYSVKNNIPIKIFNNKVSLVLTDSMKDTIDSGTYIFYKEFDDYEVGDIIVFRSNHENRLIVHEIIVKESNGFITKGSNNQADDFLLEGYITKDRILGKVTNQSTIFGIGKLVVSNKLIIIFILIIISFIIIILQLRELVKIFKQKHENELKNIN